ncbi:MAG: hypothetical protein APR53_02025 [Methanoculleus sp. SDB]|nr:MAG: hypothetical protein APR53_02025 [Methanoculleus sp. SDB]
MQPRHSRSRPGARVLAITILILFLAFSAAVPAGGASPVPVRTGSPVADEPGGEIPVAGSVDASYVLRGDYGSLKIRPDEHLLRELSGSQPPFTGDIGTYYREYIDNTAQDTALAAVVEAIASGEFDREDDAARCAISLVQHIPYRHSAGPVRYPYLALIEGGDCDDKAALMAYLLRGLGYGVALLYFEEEQHMAVGIRCPEEYGYQDTGYLFVEASMPSIPGDSGGNYPGFGNLVSHPDILPVSSGRLFNPSDEEAEDARAWQDIRDRVEKSTIDTIAYQTWTALAVKYGLPME